MIATQSQAVAFTKEPHFSHTMNNASAPLPIIPRRVPSSSRMYGAASPPPVDSMSAGPVQVTVQYSTPPGGGIQPPGHAVMEESDSSSSGLSDGTRQNTSTRAKRIRGVRNSIVCPPEQSTPTPAVHNARIAFEHRHPQIPFGKKDHDNTPRPLPRPRLYVPGISLRLTTEGLRSRNLSNPRTRASTESPASATAGSMSQQRLIRKKSGQLVKSSLKSSKSKASLSVVTIAASSKSEPNTPTHAKAVHFDAKLEHVKLFLAEQKPLAVSRDGSPTEDTSGTDNDFPSFIFGDPADGEKTRKALVMQVPNMPPAVNLNSDVALEELVLSHEGTTILGRVRVRNIAYAKWLAVRFTFDSWQTTSEVTAKYVESVDSDFDRFSFTIRLNDLLARIEGKTLFMALRYTVAGRELWDNNGGQNYRAEFSKVTPAAEKLKPSHGLPAKSDLADLRSKLEKVVQGREKGRLSALVPPTSRLVGLADTGLGATSLASRYDLGLSLKEPWKASAFTPLRHIRTQSYPASTTPTPSSFSWSEKTCIPKATPLLASPRDIDDDVLFSAPRVAIDLEITSSGERVFRNHRRGHFDINAADGSALKRTPPGTPRMRSFDDLTPLASARFHTLSSVGGGRRSAPPFGLGLTQGAIAYVESNGGSEQSTPSFISSSSNSSCSTSPSPTESFMGHALTSINDGGGPVSPNASYRQFLNKFCFFTGSERMLHIPPDIISRTQSVSDIEGLLSGASPRLHASPPSLATTPNRSPTLDGALTIRSGSSTPTPSALFESRSATPIAI